MKELQNTNAQLQAQIKALKEELAAEQQLRARDRTEALRLRGRLSVYEVSLIFFVFSIFKLIRPQRESEVQADQIRDKVADVISATMCPACTIAEFSYM